MGDEIRVGNGYDVHPFAEGRPLILGGVRFDHPRGLDRLAHVLIEVRRIECLAAHDLTSYAMPSRGLKSERRAAAPSKRNLDAYLLTSTT